MILFNKAAIEERINEEWDKKAGHLKINFLEFEDVLRSILRGVKREEIKASEAVELIDEALGAFTRRGTEL